MSSILFSLPEIYTAYKKWVSTHPQLTSDFETSIKWISYFIAGRVNNSTIVSELIYSLSNLLVFFNDRIIYKGRQQFVPIESGERLKLWLTVLDYSEVFLELSARKAWGETGKWFIIVVLQIFKCISRLLLLYYHKEQIIENPPIPVLKRKKFEQTNYTNDYAMNEARSELESVSFVLKRSGKVIRKVDATPTGFRNWKPISMENNNECEMNRKSKDLLSDGKQLFAETLYILKPIAHLGSVLCFGNNTWKPWFISLLFDITSLQMYQKSRMTKEQQFQLSRRNLALVLYLLRSPFYERHSRDRIQSFLYALSRKLPLAGMICTPLAHYIPHWQRTYFYMWST